MEALRYCSAQEICFDSSEDRQVEVSTEVIVKTPCYSKSCSALHIYYVEGFSDDNKEKNYPILLLSSFADENV